MAAVASSWPAGFTLTGGIPLKGQDLAASVLFIVAFALLVPLAVLRWVRPATRTWTLLRPSIILLVRIVTYIIRAIEANGNYSEGLFIAEQVLLLAGLIPLLEPLAVLLRAHVMRNWTPEPPSREDGEHKKVSLLNRGLRIIQLTVFVALILGIVAGAKAGKAATDPSAVSDISTYRYATIGLSLGILGLTMLIACAVHVREGLPAKGTLFILAVAILLVIPNIYKLVTALHHPAMTSAGTKAGFYALSALPELLVVDAYFCPNLNEWFGLKEASWKDKVEKRMRKGEWPEGLGYVSQEEYEGMGAGGIEMSATRDSKV